MSTIQDLFTELRTLTKMEGASDFETLKKVVEDLKMRSSRNVVQATEAVQNTCNKHVDCARANMEAEKRGEYAVHCHDDCCEECFGS